MARAKKQLAPEFTFGLYADCNSYLALTVKLANDTMHYITIDYPMQIHRMDLDEFRKRFHRCLSQYSWESAARRFLQTQQAGSASASARHALEKIAGYDLLQ